MLMGTRAVAPAHKVLTMKFIETRIIDTLWTVPYTQFSTDRTYNNMEAEYIAIGHGRSITEGQPTRDRVASHYWRLDPSHHTIASLIDIYALSCV